MILHSTTAFSSPGQGGAARYFIARHMRDEFRRESRNIGVLVEKADYIVAKFLGENAETGAFEASGALETSSGHKRRTASGCGIGEKC